MISSVAERNRNPINIWSYRDLIAQLTKREIQERYRGSAFGVLWSFMNPLLMLGVYMFVFGVVFQIKWGVQHDSHVQFGIVLFSGLVAHAFLSECLMRAPHLILTNPQFVKKVVFPLHILPVVATGTAVFHMLIGVGILILANAIFSLQINATVIFLPVVIAPLVLMGLAVGWFLSSISVFIRDTRHVVGILSTVLLFLCPIFYPVSAVPEPVRPYIYLNPLTLIVEQIRAVTLFGQTPNWQYLLIYTIVAMVLLSFSFWFFIKSRRAFSDVI